MGLGFAKRREKKFSRMPNEQVEGVTSWMKEMKRVSCSFLPSQSFGLILFAVHRLEIRARS